MFKKLLTAAVFSVCALSSAFAASQIPQEILKNGNPEFVMVMQAYEGTGKPYWWAFPATDLASSAVFNKTICRNNNVNNDIMIKLAWYGLIKKKYADIQLDEYEMQVGKYLNYKLEDSPVPENLDFYCRKLNADIDASVMEIEFAQKARGKTLEDYFD